MANANTNTALVIQYDSDNSPSLVKQDIPIQTPGKRQVLVKISHVAQNPTDIQSLDGRAFPAGGVLGCDFVGEVVELGQGVSKFKKGDLISALVWGGEIEGKGGYSQYCLAEEDIAFIVPRFISRESASTVPLALTTAWLALFSSNSLGIPKKVDSERSILVWGGSSSVGLYTIQLAKLFGFQIFTTCSPKHHDLVKSYGANHVFDYKEANVVDQIRSAAVHSDLVYTFDTIGTVQSSKQASECLEAGKGNLCTVRPGPANTEGVVGGTKISDVLVWTAFLKDHQYKDFKYPACQEDHDLAKELNTKIPRWLEEGSITPSNTKLYNGLDCVEKGFQEYRDGHISAYKIVYQVA
ncbi:uncharacterized protein I303_104788 [Kwoniella dejecticola CBS 10117]|uniref:Enoyl reductase (ER) domain-containing protein n=1 Tax=Kwoniella dejecticola CBS 10117 TaxID=1296121 RepID=A0A1A6A4C7_9TREE|nr:uncharacterized protein I303_04231 [Kwoniella dejecticola CBS 10117]OBR84909.1 hypothetical protein I303_04231 [Kwoniella dejecticola CBS 10117]